MRFLIMLEQTEAGFAVQAPDLAIATFGENIEAAKRAAGDIIVNVYQRSEKVRIRRMVDLIVSQVEALDDLGGDRPSFDQLHFIFHLAVRWLSRIWLPI